MSAIEGLSLDNVLTGDEAAALFDPQEEIQEVNTETNESTETPDKKDETQEVTETIDAEDLFAEKSESVGNDENKGKEDTSSENVTSPNFYSSIAKAFAEDGVFQDLNDEDVSKVTDADSFKELIEQRIQSQLDERQKRIDEALNVGIEPTKVQKFENNMKILNSITTEAIEEEGEQAENLRKNIIYEDLIQKGFSKERAMKAIERSVEAGTDIEDAKESLQSCKEQMDKAYKDAVEEAKQARQQEEQELKDQAEALKQSILSDKKAFGELELDKTTRQKIFEAILKPVYTDPDTGEKLTAIQKYESDNHADFLKYLGLTFVLTNGFKSLDGLVKGKVRKEVNKHIRELEHTLNSTSRNADGSLKFASGVSSDPESIYKNFTLDL
jgi:hypothetical protein